MYTFIFIYITLSFRTTKRMMSFFKVIVINNENIKIVQTVLKKYMQVPMDGSPVAVS